MILHHHFLLSQHQQDVELFHRAEKDYVYIQLDSSCFLRALFCIIIYKFFFLIMYETLDVCTCIYTCIYTMHVNVYMCIFSPRNCFNLCTLKFATGGFLGPQKACNWYHVELNLGVITVLMWLFNWVWTYEIKHVP